MTAAAAVLVAFATGLIRPPSPTAVRLRALGGPAGSAALRRIRAPRAAAGVLVPGCCGAVTLAGWSFLGFGVAVPLLPAVAGGVVGATAGSVLSRNLAERAVRRSAAALVESVGILAADLRAGQQPAAAVAALQDDQAAHHPAVRVVWAVSERSGAPVAAVLDRIEQDLRDRECQAREVAAQLAGARSTAGLLAVLPVLGIGLGAAMGADPLAVLLGGFRGQIALLVGAILESLGVLWTGRIVAAAQGAR